METLIHVCFLLILILKKRYTIPINNSIHYWTSDIQLQIDGLCFLFVCFCLFVVVVVVVVVDIVVVVVVVLLGLFTVFNETVEDQNINVRNCYIKIRNYFCFSTDSVKNCSIVNFQAPKSKSPTRWHRIFPAICLFRFVSVWLSNVKTNLMHVKALCFYSTVILRYKTRIWSMDIFLSPPLNFCCLFCFDFRFLLLEFLFFIFCCCCCYYCCLVAVFWEGGGAGKL